MKSHLAVVPSIEHRLDAWVNIQEHLAAKREAPVRPTITLSRAYGCEGFPLAVRLVELMSDATHERWNLYDRALLEAVEKQDGVSPDLLRRLGDAQRGLETLGLGPTDEYHQKEALDAVSRRIRQVAALGNAVLIGRGSSLLCHEMKNCFHFRLEAPLAYRVKSLAARMRVTEKEAEQLVRSNGERREQFISKSLGGNITEFANFDAVFNNERHGVDDIAHAIAAYVKHAWPDQGLFSTAG